MTFFYLLWAGLLFFLPGILLHRRWPSALPPLTIYAMSAGLWFLAWQVMNLIGVPFSRLGLSMVGVAMIGAAAFLGRSASAPEVVRRESWGVKPDGIEWVWFGAAALGATSLIIRGVCDPLSGWDNKSRWEWLALEWIRVGDLSGYPPRAPADFEHYPWLDGLPPLVAGMNAYLYVMIGSTAKAWTAIRVVGEMILAGYAIGALAKGLWGPRAFWPALGVAGSSALLVWSIANGQEIGQLIVAFSGAAALLVIRAENADHRSDLGVGFLAALGAASREYGGALVALAALYLLLRRPVDRGGMVRFVLPTALIVGLWYGRNIVLTGNPLYPLSPGGLLATEEFYTALNASIADIWGWGGTLIAPQFIVAAVVVLAGLIVLFGVLGLPLLWRADRRWLIVWMGVVVGLWAWSVPYTSGGYYYSLRVLAPALALGAATAGWVGARAHPWVKAGCAALTLLVALDGARRAWFLPNAGFVSPWSLSMAPWARSADSPQRLYQDPALDEIVELANGSVIVVDRLEVWVALRQRGARVMFIRNPATRPVYDNTQTADEIIRSLQMAEIAVVLLSIDQPPAFRDLTKSAFLVNLLREYEPAVVWGGSIVYRLDQLRPSKD